MKDFKGTKDNLYAVEYAGTIIIQNEDKYGNYSVLEYDNVGKEVADANARLMIIASKLLDASQNVLEMLSYNRGEKIPVNAWDAAVDHLRDTINKALGKEASHE